MSDLPINEQFRSNPSANIQLRVRDIAIIKTVLAVVILAIMVLTFRFPIPLLVAVIDLAFIPVYVWLARRYPVAATYLLLAETTLAFTPRQFVQGYVNGVNWLFYLPLPLAASYIINKRGALLRATLLVSGIAIPIMLIAALTLPPRVERGEIFTLIAYVVVLLWGFAWIGDRISTQQP